MSYWDTSCLVKLYTPERDSTTFVQHLAAHPQCVTADLAELEFWSTVRRKEAEGLLNPGEARLIDAGFKADIKAAVVNVVPVDATVRAEFEQVMEQCLAQTPPIFIRTNDALHLAAARCAGESEVVATDKRLREAALFLGFTLFPAA